LGELAVNQRRGGVWGEKGNPTRPSIHNPLVGNDLSVAQPDKIEKISVLWGCPILRKSD
jgi:hypothetical protein